MYDNARKRSKTGQRKLSVQQLKAGSVSQLRMWGGNWRLQGIGSFTHCYPCRALVAWLMMILHWLRSWTRVFRWSKVHSSSIEALPTQALGPLTTSSVFFWMSRFAVIFGFPAGLFKVGGADDSNESNGNLLQSIGKLCNAVSQQLLSTESPSKKATHLL